MKSALTFLAIAAAVALSACSNVEAQSTPVVDNLSWVAPTQYTDNSAIQPGELEKTVVVWGTQPGGPYNGGSVDVPAPATTASLTRAGNGYGTRCYRVAAVAKGVQGLWSGEACKTVQAPPKAPTNLTVQ